MFGPGLYVIHSGGMLIANFYVGLFTCFSRIPEHHPLHLKKKVKTLATSAPKGELSMGETLGDDDSLAEAKERRKRGNSLTL